MYVRYVWGFVRAVEEYPHQAVRARVVSGEMCVTSIKGGYPTGGVTDAAMSVVSESHRGSVGGRGGRLGGRTVALGRAVAEDHGTTHPVCHQPDRRRCGGKSGNRGLREDAPKKVRGTSHAGDVTGVGVSGGVAKHSDLPHVVSKDSEKEKGKRISTLKPKGTS